MLSFNFLNLAEKQKILWHFLKEIIEFYGKKSLLAGIMKY